MEPGAREPVVELAPPLSEVAWSPEFLTQTLEPLLVYLGTDGAHCLRPVHAPTLRLGWAPGADPGGIVLAAVERYGLSPILVHSTSWRHEGDRVVLTYVVAVTPPPAAGEFLVDEPVVRADLARGDAFGPPLEIGVAQVLEHALRHLAWLVRDDPVVGSALEGWDGFLTGYEPAPFRSLGPTAT